MSVQELLMEAPLVAMLLIAAITDLRTRRIPNWLTVTMLATGLMQSLTACGLVTPGQALLGALAGFAIPLLLYIVGGLGAGDVKLFCGIGAWLGPRTVLLVIAAAALVGLATVLGQCLVQRRMATLMRNTALLIVSLFNLPRLGLKHVVATGQSCRSVARPMPYALMVLLGTLAVMLFPLVRSDGGLL